MMKTPDDNLIVVKSYKFALRIIKLYKHLVYEHKEYVIARQILRSGTGIGANIKEGTRAQTRPDFITKMAVAGKEAAETEYWIGLLRDGEFITERESESLLAGCQEIIKILVAINKTATNNLAGAGSSIKH